MGSRRSDASGNASIYKWLFELVGDAADIDFLRGELVALPTEALDGGGLALAVDAPDAFTANSEAQDLVRSINGAGTIIRPGYRGVRAGALYRRRDDGKRDFYLIAETGAYVVSSAGAELVGP